jgi:hypothetical protein
MVQGARSSDRGESAGSGRAARLAQGLCLTRVELRLGRNSTLCLQVRTKRPGEGLISAFLVQQPHTLGPSRLLLGAGKEKEVRGCPEGY